MGKSGFRKPNPFATPPSPVKEEEVKKVVEPKKVPAPDKKKGIFSRKNK